MSIKVEQVDSGYWEISDTETGTVYGTHCATQAEAEEIARKLREAAGGAEPAAPKPKAKK